MSTRIISLNPFGTGQCLSTKTRFHCCSIFESQSLWNRAVSFDQYPKSLALMDELVSIPLEQGSVFRLNMLNNNNQTSSSQSLWNRAVSFDNELKNTWESLTVSIPLEQGSVFRRNKREILGASMESQSLWNRAVSFDAIEPFTPELGI